ncbi:MAG TPA: adenine deaminase [Bacteroidia bacterium]|nr:adenine deaminase [Bacteroidia bacterium]
MTNKTIVQGNLVDIHQKRIYPAELLIENKKIQSIKEIDAAPQQYILPGFIDAHVHVESSMLIPSEFARAAVVHGTVATISDPHEIANVIGVAGVEYMLDNAAKVPFHFFFGAPSCVPATSFETAGAVIDSTDIEKLIARPEIVYLAEMMNFPGVINNDEEVLKKLQAAKTHNKPIDGHAPGLMGDIMKAYFAKGISTDHECYMYQEALEKLQFGVKVMIREGSAAKNFETLIPLLDMYPEQIMFCSDDKHPDGLVVGHINLLVKCAVAKGCKLFNVLRAVSYNVVQHYNLPVGLLREGDGADFIITDNLIDFNVLYTYIKGECVSQKGKTNIPRVEATIVNNFNCDKKSPADFKIKAQSKTIRVIEAIDGQLITNEIHCPANNVNGFLESDIPNDVLKIVVVNRYANAPVAVAFVKNVGLKNGAIASCVAHDCHNIVAVGTNDVDLCEAVNLIIENKGGVSLANANNKQVLPLPVAGIMSTEEIGVVAKKYITIDKAAKQLGTTLQAPYMTLSFLALLVIPQLKLSDRGLFSGKTFQFVSNEIDIG